MCEGTESMEVGCVRVGVWRVYGVHCEVHHADGDVVLFRVLCAVRT